MPIFAFLFCCSSCIFLSYQDKMVTVLGFLTGSSIFAYRYYICADKILISWCENVCQEYDCVQGVGAGVTQVYIAHAAPFGN